jgi:2-polyprenyl-3-methyl-5-hydroxy-6-metoxy-1,4-benzoquinol methylase
MFGGVRALLGKTRGLLSFPIHALERLPSDVFGKIEPLVRERDAELVGAAKETRDLVAHAIDALPEVVVGKIEPLIRERDAELVGAAGETRDLVAHALDALPDVMAGKIDPLIRERHADLRSFAERTLAVSTSLSNVASDVSRAVVELKQATIGAARAAIRDRYGEPSIYTDHPVAVNSPDHLVPWGTARDNSRSDRFNARLFVLLHPERRSLLDLGCSGGGSVRSLIELGVFAVGIEGSDYSLQNLRAEWSTIPEFLFTADITKPFTVSTHAQDPFLFGVVTLWEVAEHLREECIPQMLANVDRHLAPGGLVIMSISPNSDVIEGVELHQTIKPKAWWIQRFEELGWTNHDAIVNYFGSHFVRGGEDAPNSFHVVLARAGETPVTRKSFSDYPIQHR